MRILKYLKFHPLQQKRLLIFSLSCGLIIAGIAEPGPSFNVRLNCDEINASFEVTSGTGGGPNNAIILDIKDAERTSLIISLVGPKKLFLRDVKESEIKNLAKGTYSLVIVGRAESSGYCPKHFQVIIN